MEHSHKRSNFSSKLGYVFAAAGSAVGLGNIWRFPYLAAEYGGGIFLLTYLVLAVTFGFAMLLSESAIGRMTGKSSIGAFRALGAKKLMFGGWMGAIIPLLIAPYYSVIGGWVCKYLFEYVTGNRAALAEDAYFGGFLGQIESPILWFVVFAGATFIIVALGVEKGVERVSKILMPVLVLMAILLSIYSITRPGAVEGIKYYLIPDFSKFSIMTVVAAMGQMFYSLSIAMGILITYGSYMKKDIDMESAIGQIEIMDTSIAFLAGMMIIPAVFAFAGGGEPNINAGPSLMFVTMPKVFDSMPMGGIAGAGFFLLVLFAALTSAISLFETCVSVFQDELKWNRVKSCVTVGGIILGLGIVNALGFNVWSWVKPLGMDDILTFFDFLTNSIMMPIVAIAVTLLVIKVIGFDKIIEEVKTTSAFKREKAYVFCTKYLVIPGLLIILISSILNGFGIITM